MPASEDLAAYFDTVDGDAELVTVQGVQVAAIVDLSTELVLGDVLVRAPSLLVPATVAAAEGGAVTLRSTAYRVRQVIDLPPDAALRRVVLAEGA